MLELADSHDVAAAWFAESVAAAATTASFGLRQVALVQRCGRAGQMAPLHRRDEAETYRVEHGRVTFFVGGETVQASPGDVVVAPAGAARTARVDSAEASWTVLTHVRSLGRFADFARAISPPVDPAGGWPSAHEHVAVAVIAAENGIELLGPPGALPGATPD